MEKVITFHGGTPSRKPQKTQDTYFIACHTKSGKLRAIKIGVCARGSAVKRLRTLQTGSVDKLKLLAVYQGNVERKLHRLFKASRLRKNSEFFKPTKELLALIERLREISTGLQQLDTIPSGAERAA